MRKKSLKARRVAIVRPRVYIGDDLSIGPGKVDLLQQIAISRSISAAARALEMPYKRAWLLIDALNQGFGHPVVLTEAGGKHGGGTTLTPLGEALIVHYTALEQRINAAAVAELKAIAKLLK